MLILIKYYKASQYCIVKMIINDFNLTPRQHKEKLCFFFYFYIITSYWNTITDTKNPSDTVNMQIV